MILTVKYVKEHPEKRGFHITEQYGNMILPRKKIQQLIEKYKNSDPAKLEPYIKSILVSHFKFVSGFGRHGSRDVPVAIRKLFNEVNDGSEFETHFETKKMKGMKPVIDYRVQDMLVKQQTNNFDRALATPDFLFTYTIAVKSAGKSKTTFHVNWIDVKDFFGMSNTFEAKKLAKQAARNVILFGPGAFVFSLGVEKELKEYLEKKFTAIIQKHGARQATSDGLPLLKLFAADDITLHKIKVKK